MENRSWIITGTGSGIGYELCKYALRQGDCVTALTRNKEKLCTKLGANSEKLLIVEVDLTSKESMQDAVDKAKEKFGKIDILVNNAGYELTGYIEELTMEEVKEVFEVNFFAPIQMAQLILPIMREQKSGYIINMASLAGTLYSCAGSLTYNASKAAFDSFSKTLASEVKKFGINVTSLILGQFNTDFFDNLKWTKGTMNVYKDEGEIKKENIYLMNHKQKGDVAKLCQLVYEIAGMENPPIELFVGEDTYQLAYGKAISTLNKLSAWERKCRNISI